MGSSFSEVHHFSEVHAKSMKGSSMSRCSGAVLNVDSLISVDSQADDTDVPGWPPAELSETIEKMKIVMLSWDVQLGTSRYTRTLREDVGDLMMKVIILESSLTAEPDPEITVNYKVEWECIVKKYSELEEELERFNRPAKRLRRVPSGDVPDDQKHLKPDEKHLEPDDEDLEANEKHLKPDDEYLATQLEETQVT